MDTQRKKLRTTSKYLKKQEITSKQFKKWWCLNIYEYVWHDFTSAGDWSEYSRTCSQKWTAIRSINFSYLTLASRYWNHTELDARFQALKRKVGTCRNSCLAGHWDPLNVCQTFLACYNQNSCINDSSLSACSTCWFGLERFPFCGLRSIQTKTRKTVLSWLSSRWHRTRSSQFLSVFRKDFGTLHSRQTWQWQLPLLDRTTSSTGASWGQNFQRKKDCADKICARPPVHWKCCLLTPLSRDTTLLCTPLFSSLFSTLFFSLLYSSLL